MDINYFAELFLSKGQVIPLGQYLFAALIGGGLGAFANILAADLYDRHGLKVYRQPRDPKQTETSGAHVRDRTSYWVRELVKCLLVGLAGAGGLFFLLAELEKLPSDWLINDVVYLYGVSVVGGFVAIPMLNAVSGQALRLAGETRTQVDRIESEVREEVKALQEKLARAEVDARVLQSDLKAKSSELVNTEHQQLIEKALLLLSFAKDHADPEHPTGYSQSFVKRKQTEIERIEDELRRALGSSQKRQLSIILGRVLRLRNKIPDAISVLSRLVDVSGGDDRADALYNRACYHVISARPAIGDINGDDARIRDALADLSESCRLKSSNKADARDDPDFEPIRKLPGYTAIVEAG